MSKLILDEWLSNVISKPVYFLETGNIELSHQNLPKGPSLIWTKIPVNDISKLISLQNLGFYIVDTNILFVLSKKIFFKKNSKLRFAKSEDESEVRKLAKKAFNHSRFYGDPNISNDLASKIKDEWAGNFFKGNRGKWMVVVEENSKIVGFLQLIEKNKNNIVIDLIAIDEKNRGKGLAQEMISFAGVNCIDGEGVIEVGTQIANKSSINLYSKLGFNVNTAFYVLHLHI